MLLARRSSFTGTFILERFLRLLPPLSSSAAMSSPDAALQKIEQARALIEDAKALIEEKGEAEKEILELKKKLADRERELRSKDRELQQKDQDLKRKDREIARKAELLEKSKQPIKTFIQKEIRQSYRAVAEAKQAHAQAPSKYTAGFVELAKGSHAEYEELFKRLASAAGIDYGALEIDLEGLESDVAVEGKAEIARPAVIRKATPREPLHASRYADRTKKLERRDSGTAVQ
ncbi:uncharacterized protein EI97DRAFT_499425 [Westerdykella ornata]|uniref:Uncharacterized protein n=1 Tax=Westerdykella ornata TaxID=318751 RepID=A0A6A6JQH5_WESOR|nr:uncharacterized protein EI97DRAFT_499425 [Westerdykella ornata]KAF2278881.1 hypothetical protein EI97DRAFT_499425 [Westerdykella ornata]